MNRLFDAVSQIFSRFKTCYEQIPLKCISPVTALADKYNLVECLHQVWLGWLHLEDNQRLRFGCFLFAIASRDALLCTQVTRIFDTSPPLNWNKSEAEQVGINVYWTLVTVAKEWKTWEGISDNIDWVKALAVA